MKNYYPWMPKVAFVTLFSRANPLNWMEDALAPFDPAALPPHALPWSGVDGISQPGTELLAQGTRGNKTKRQRSLSNPQNSAA
jgi:hypothetical protein